MNASLENFKRLSDGKDDNSWAQPPEPLTQVVGDCFSVVVTHLQSPSDFIVQKVENASKIFVFCFSLHFIFSESIFILFFVFCLTGIIRELQLKLREHCYQVTTPQNFRPAPGTVCCAQFSSTVKLSEHQSKISPVTTQLYLKIVLGMLNYCYFISNVYFVRIFVKLRSVFILQRTSSGTELKFWHIHQKSGSVSATWILVTLRMWI